MKLVVNGEEREVQAATLAELFEAEARERDLHGVQGFAMALNGRVVRRDAWGETPVSEGDRIEIVRAMQGG
jgi:sulfur carrier protein